MFCGFFGDCIDSPGNIGGILGKISRYSVNDGLRLERRRRGVKIGDAGSMLKNGEIALKH